MKIRFILASIILAGHWLHAQDPHFSQFFASPLTLNPASTGNFDGKLRVAGNYRDQWPTIGNTYTTSTLSIDGKLPIKNLPTNDRLSAGLLLLSDKSGGGILKQNFYGVSLAYTKALSSSGDQQLTAGIQGVYGEYRFDASLANFEDELGPAGFTLPSGDAVLTASPVQRFADLHAGIFYQGSFSADNLFYVGTSLYHLNRPRLFFSAPESVISFRYNVQGGYYQEISDYLRLHFSMQFQQQRKYQELVVGGALSYLVDERQARNFELYLGLWARNKDALIPYVGVDWKNIRAGYTYDVVLPGQRPGAARYQSNEFSLIWYWRQSLATASVKCPKF